MKSAVGRRVFVGSMVAGLPLAAGPAGLLAQPAGGLGQAPATAHDHAAAGVDPVVDHLVRQIALIHNAAQAGPRGEHFRALATQLRTLAVYDRQIGIDTQVRRALKQLVDREGRNAILYAEPDLEMRRKNLASFGFKPEARSRQVLSTSTHADREAALDRLLQRGITPIFDRMAATADLIAMRIEMSPLRPVAQDADFWRGFCAELWNQYQQAQEYATPFCTLAKWFPAAMAACAALEGGAGVLLGAYFYECL